MRRSDDERTSPATRESERHGTVGCRQTRNTHRSTPEGGNQKRRGGHLRSGLIHASRSSNRPTSSAAMRVPETHSPPFQPLDRREMPGFPPDTAMCHRGRGVGRGGVVSARRAVFRHRMPRPQAVAVLENRGKPWLFGPALWLRSRVFMDRARSRQRLQGRSVKGTSARFGVAERNGSSNSRGRPVSMLPLSRGAEEFPLDDRGGVFRIGTDRRSSRFERDVRDVAWVPLHRLCMSIAGSSSGRRSSGTPHPPAT